MDNQKLIHRLNRASGQINAIKQSIEKEEDECIETLQQLKASINALKKFGEAYMKCHLETCLNKGMSKDEAKKNLMSVISGAFSL